MANYKWNQLSEIYTEPEGILNKGTTLFIKITCDKPVDELNTQILKSVLNDWMYPYRGKDIKPFKLMEFTRVESELKVRLLFKTKNTEEDELKLLLQDILNFLNSDHISVNEINAMIDN
ncbi:hypothetical protein [Paenibacillus sp. S150]|uniref:hypothetical protein n=1 Tax=Paenibacillus sp. S150 TaxID=2749826 RepID=UPI001C5772B0|nr:hypothetical protein [Paenibacillus sp. S150]MBW4082932.1 hypothetical protein [Paenibacillus sp. S150]